MSADLTRYRMLLAKEEFKFSAAHFTLLPDGRAELLHGHNYRVQVALAGGGLDAEGLLVDIETFKKELRRECARLDSRTLLPAESGRLDWTREGDAVEVRCGERSGQGARRQGAERDRRRRGGRPGPEDCAQVAPPALYRGPAAAVHAHAQQVGSAEEGGPPAVGAQAHGERDVVDRRAADRRE